MNIFFNKKVVYIAPGTYEVTSEILMNTDTILMGDATNVRTFLSVIFAY